MTPREINASLRTLQSAEDAAMRLPMYMVAVLAFALGVLVMDTAQSWRDTRAVEFAQAVDWRKTCADLGYSGFVAGQSDSGVWELRCH